jgi:hypothetical protein
MDDEEIPPQASERRSGNDAGGTVGRDVGRDEGRDQATWRDLVARLELPTPVDPVEAPWPERENLRPRPAPSTAGSQATAAPAPDLPEDDSTDLGTDSGTAAKSDKGPSADRSRVIRPAGSPKPSEQATGQETGPADPDAEVTLGGPRDYGLADEADFPDDEDDRYIPPPVPPGPKLDPVAKGAWLALFGGPGYLLLATLMGWQLAGWTELVSVVAFIAGFVVLVFRLGDGPSKKDGPDQGAVV